MPGRGPAALVAAMAVASSACALADRSGAAGPSLPSPALAWLDPDSLRTELVGDGVFYHFAWSARGPWAVHLVSADLTRCELELAVVPAVGEDGVTRTRKTVTAMAPRGEVTPLAGVNGDFFAPDGSPAGPEVTANTRRSSTRPAIAWDSGRTPRIGSDTVSGWAGDPAAGLQVVGGFPELLDSGVRVDDLGVAERPQFAAVRHPRTAVGYGPRHGLLWLVVVDGRRNARSAGMTLPELTELLESLGVAEALNLDGGGSSAMALGRRLVSTPSDVTGERPVGNSLWLVRDGSDCGVAYRAPGARSHLSDSPRWPPRPGPGSKYRPPKALTTTEEA
ncbi:MAG: phosphodiester glycosidase family protein [Gemmatimonadota bacterium]|nr:phosphodiester glycosidase family protein [Gemmatimonadota bacterium]